MNLMLKNVRLSFPSLFVPRAFEGNEPKFSATFLLDDTALAATRAAIDAAAKERWEGKAVAILKALGTNAMRWPLKHNPTKQSGEPLYDGDAWVIKGSNKARPLVIDRDRSPLVEADGRPYGGCYVNAKLDVWAQDNKFGKAINIKLLGVQFWADGERFGADSSAKPDDFDFAPAEADDSEQW